MTTLILKCLFFFFRMCLQRYPVMWQGLLALKNAHAAVQMHFVSGNPNIARASLPPIENGETAPVRISQRMRLDPAQLDGVYRKIQVSSIINVVYLNHIIIITSPGTTFFVLRRQFTLKL